MPFINVRVLGNQSASFSTKSTLSMHLKPGCCVRVPKTAPMKKGTFFPQVTHSVTKEIYPQWVTELENKAVVLHCLAQSSAAGDQNLGGSAGNFRKVNTLEALNQLLAQNRCARNTGSSYYYCHPPQGVMG